MRRRRGRPPNPDTQARYLQITKFVYRCRGAMYPCQEREIIKKAMEAFGLSRNRIYKALKAIGRTPELEHEMADASLWLDPAMEPLFKAYEEGRTSIRPRGTVVIHKPGDRIGTSALDHKPKRRRLPRP